MTQVGVRPVLGFSHFMQFFAKKFLNTNLSTECRDDGIFIYPIFLDLLLYLLREAK